MVEMNKWQVKSNGLNFIIFDPEDDFRTVAECARKEDAEEICSLASRVAWRTDALRDAQHTKGDLHCKISTLTSLAHAAKFLCEWTRDHEYPEKMTTEFMELTSLIDQLDTEVRRIFPKV